MPKRIIDGEGLWRSQKIAKVMPERFRAEFANLVPLALANGVFEADADMIWSTVYSYNRPDITREDVAEILGEFERVGLLTRWQEVNGIQKALNGNQPEGKVWGYWIGIDRPGRLPGKSRQGKNEKVGPTPPQSMDSIECLSESVERSPDSIERSTGTDLRLGFGSGSGFGFGSGREATSPKEDQIIEIARAYPKIGDPLHLNRIVAEEIGRAIERHGFDRVSAETKRRVSTDNQKFLPAPEKFFRDSEYLVHVKSQPEAGRAGILGVSGVDLKRAAAERLAQ